MIHLDKEEQILCRRLMELSNNSYHRKNCTFSDFLNLNEQNIFYGIVHELPKIKYFSYGGFTDAERKILCFCGDDTITGQEEISFPIDCIRMVPRNKKFSDDLTHRDFLGAIINLGIERTKLGDILIEDNEGYLFCSTAISSFIIQQLCKVKHTMISCSLIEQGDFNYVPQREEIVGTVTSVRLDSILSVAFRSSRSSLTGLIAGGKVFVNSKEVISNSYILKENDVVSVRGLGKFVYVGTTYQTKKGRYAVKVLLYR